jgi:hypothetical protein
MRIILAMCIFGMVITVLPFHAHAQPAPGACCLSDGSCLSVYNQGDCFESNGIWQGAGTSCDPNPCQQGPSAVPTMTEWGMILFIAIAGLGAVYYLKRQRRA